MNLKGKSKRASAGQSTIEAAYTIPLIFVLLLLLIQPGILLYNQMVMQAAAAEGCRLLATKTDGAGQSYEACEKYLLRRLGSIPPQNNFHLHEGECSWDIELKGDEHSDTVEVVISHAVKPLPLLDMGASLLGLTDGAGNVSQVASAASKTQPSWVLGNELGMNPREWVEQWR